MDSTLFQTDLKNVKYKSFYRGKVRDVYFLRDQLIMVATDRISAFDHVLGEQIPYKGQVLNQMSSYFLEKSAHIAPNWLIATPDPNVSIGKLCEPIRLEMVIRGYLTGHAWRLYEKGVRKICGVQIPDGMKENQKFTSPIITPAFKALEGHDEDISKEEILDQNIVTVEQYKILEDYTYSLFEFGTKMANDRDLILVDTKYEFGIYKNEIILIDEIHTPDSSRYFYSNDYLERFDRGEKPIQLSKEFVREWLVKQGFHGLEGQAIPKLPRDFIEIVSEKYIELFERMTGKRFARAWTTNINDRINANLTFFFVN